jgi:glycosyltransferase involved in cell wall biosynthesis
MYVVHIDRQRSWTGQINRAFLVASELRRRGHRIGFVTHPGAALARRAEEAGIPVDSFPLRGGAFYASIFRAARALRGRGVDLFHCHGARDHLFGLAVARLASIPHVIRTKHNHTLPRGHFSRWVYAKSDRVIAVSEHVRQGLVGAGIDPAQLETIQDGIDVEHFRPLRRDSELARSIGIGADDLVVGSVCSLHTRKGIEEILRAFRILQNASCADRLKCLLVGKRRERWDALARELGVAERVVFPGFRRDVREMLSLFDVYLLPSRSEAGGTSVLEAMAMERPVVVSAVGGLAESVTPETGISIPPRDPEALAAAVYALLEDPDRAARLGRAARRRVVAQYSTTALVDRTLVLYERTLKGAP